MRLSRKWLIAVALALASFYLALTTKNFVLYAVSFIVLGFAQILLPSDIKIARMFTSSIVGKMISVKFRLIKLTKILAPLLALFAFIVQKDFMTLFYAICVPSIVLFSFSGVDFTRILLPSILLSAGIIGNCVIAVSTPVKYPTAVKVASFIFVNSFTVPSLLYLIKAYREEKGRGFLLTGQILGIGLLMVGIAPIVLFAMIGETIVIPWAILGLAVSGISAYYLALTFSGKLWTTQVCYGDLFNEAISVLTQILDRRKVKYDIKVRDPLIPSLQIPPPYRKFIILSPFKGTIVVRKWIHRASKYLVPVGEAGLIVEVRPGPRKASRQFKKIVAEFLEKLDLPARDWKV
ncbi:MAG: hypothetical protein DRJ51_04510 [Thermoprotei archaeon]|nr:MAG: hypothetical protein DRJ51_04510 [Thermoprotei archaeon]